MLHDGFWEVANVTVSATISSNFAFMVNIIMAYSHTASYHPVQQVYDLRIVRTILDVGVVANGQVTDHLLRFNFEIHPPVGALFELQQISRNPVGFFQCKPHLLEHPEHVLRLLRVR